MTPLYLARIEDLRHGDLVKVDCAAVALLTPEFLLRLGISPRTKVLDLNMRVRCRGCAVKGRAIVSISGGGRMSRCIPSRSVPQSVFEGRGDFDPLGFPKVVFVETPALDWRERLALSVRFDRRGVAHLRWAFE